MRRTKSMNYNETTESKELFLYATNDGGLYNRMITPTIENLRRKAVKGAYDKEKAIDAYYYIATEASKMYSKDFGYSFSVSDRFTAAVDMEEYYREDEVFYGMENKVKKGSVLDKLHQKQDQIKSSDSTKNHIIEKDTGEGEHKSKLSQDRSI